MKKFFFLFLCVLINLSAYATVHTVCNDPIGVAQFDEIQPAIDAATSGDTIYVHGSLTRYEAFSIINKRLIIIGPGWGPDNPFTRFKMSASVGRVFIGGAGASGTEIHGLLFDERVLAIDAHEGTIPSNLRIIRNEFRSNLFNISIGQTFASGHIFESLIFEGNFFNFNAIVGKNTNKYKNFTFRNNLFAVQQLPFSLPNSSDFLIDHNLFFKVAEPTELSSASCQFFTFTNNVFNEVNLATSSPGGVALSTFRNNITFNTTNNTPWNVNDNIDGGGNIGNENPQMADQDKVDFGNNNPLLDFTIASGPANNSALDGKDIGLLYDPTGTLNWNESRNSNLPRVRTMLLSDQPIVSDTLLAFAIAQKSPGTADFLTAEFFIDRDPGFGSGTTIGLPTSADSIGFNLPVPINSLSEGTYRLSIRIQLIAGTWSLFETFEFRVANDPPVANAGIDRVVTLPEDSVALDGSSSLDPDGAITLFWWTKVSGPEQGTIVNNNQMRALAKDLVAGSYLFELLVQDNADPRAIDADTIMIIVNDPPVGKAGNDVSITLPTNSLTLDGSQSFDADGVITSFQWRQISGPSTATIQTPGQATTLVSDLFEGSYSFELLVTDNHEAEDKDIITVTVNPVPLPPNANAGADRFVVLPTNFAKLDGRASSDPDGTITAFSWRKVSGPAGGTLSSPTQSVTFANNLTSGIYEFELRVTDDSGLSDTDRVRVTVTKPPVANAGPDQTITLPSSSVTLNGSSSFDPDGTIDKFLWTKISGPSSFKITNPNQAITSVTNLVAGTYQFKLVVTDNSNATAIDVVQVTVNNSSPAARVASARSEVTDEHQSIQVYPNPFKEKINIKVPAQCSGTLVDILGRKLIDLKLSSGVNEVNTDKLVPGFYYLQIGMRTVKVQRK